MLSVTLATVLALLGRPAECPPLPNSPPIVVHTATGTALILLDPAPPPSCFNVAVITWTDAAGTREIFRAGDESMTTASAFRAKGLDLVFVSSTQLSASTEWSYSQLLWLRPHGRLQTLDVEPHSACRGYELPALGEPTGYGGYYLHDGVVRFKATYSPNRPDMVYVSARLALVKAKGTYSLRVVSCKVERPGA